MESDCGTRIIVESRQNRKNTSPIPRSIVFHCRRKGRSTRGFGLRSRRTNETSRKKLPHKNSALNNPDLHQSRRCPWSRAANRRANPALAYRNPAKLGGAPLFLAGGDAGMP